MTDLSTTLQSLPIQEPLTLPTQVGHLPYCSFSVQSTEIARAVFEQLDAHQDFPGVIVYDGSKCLGLISRQRWYEQIGQPFGIEIFLRRSIRVLFERVAYPTQPISASASIEQSVQMALRRPIAQIYEPLLIQFDDQKVHMVDLHDLLLAHSRLLVHANQMVRKQLQIEQTLFPILEWDATIEQIFTLLYEIAPYDTAMLLLENQAALRIIASQGMPDLPPNTLLRGDCLESQVYQEVRVTQRPLLTVGTGILRDLSYDFNLPSPQYWLGLPLLQSENVVGMLTLSRQSGKNFSQEEITAGINFCRQAMIAIQNAARFQQSV